MQIDYLDYLPSSFRASAITLYFNALREKLEPILGSDDRVKEALGSQLASNKCITAICDQELAGILGIQDESGGFINPTLKSMIKLYGIFGGLLRMSSLAMLHHRTAADELYVDGVAVADQMRGRGIGSQLFERLERIASQKSVRKISLEVIDTNQRARVLYERIGFAAKTQRTTWPLNLFINFPFKSATLMVKLMS